MLCYNLVKFKMIYVSSLFWFPDFAAIESWRVAGGFGNEREACLDRAVLVEDHVVSLGFGFGV